jgi:hypothetical protein
LRHIPRQRLDAALSFDGGSPVADQPAACANICSIAISLPSQAIKAFFS